MASSEHFRKIEIASSEHFVNFPQAGISLLLIGLTKSRAIEYMLTRVRACEQLQKFCEHEQASTRLIFASNSSKGQFLRALLNWMGPFDTPLMHADSFLYISRVAASIFSVYNWSITANLRIFLHDVLFLRHAPYLAEWGTNANDRWKYRQDCLHF